MRVQVVMAKTMGELTSLKRLVALVAIGLALPALLSAFWWRPLFQSGSMSLEMQTAYLGGVFMVMSFLWMAGFYLAYFGVAYSGLESVAKEEARGTLLLMISKPISRLQLILGKYLALVVTALLLEAVLLLGTVVVFWGVIGIDPDTLEGLLGLVPWVFLFSIIVIVLFAALSIALSSTIRNDAVRGIAMMAVLALVFAGGPIMRAAFPDHYETYRVYYVDGSYNLGNAYVPLLEQAERGRMTPQSQAWLGLITGAYRAGPETVLTMFLGGPAGLDPDLGAMAPSLERTTYVPPLVSVALCLAAVVAALGIATVSLNRREVQ